MMLTVCNVRQRDTMHTVAERAPRTQIAVRLNQAGLERVRQLAAEETDGNVSLMIRKLLTEALQHRDREQRR